MCKRLEVEGVEVRTDLRGVRIEKKIVENKQMKIKNIYDSPFIVSCFFQDETKNTENESKKKIKFFLRI